MWGLMRSPWGRAFKALRENPVRAESLGLDIRRITLLAFAIGSALRRARRRAARAAGPVHRADLLRARLLAPHPADGGRRRLGLLLRPDARRGIVVLLPEFLRFTEGYYLILYSTFVIVLMVWSPAGLIGLAGKLAARFRPRTARGDLEEGARP